MRECFLRMFSVPKGLCRNFRFAEMWPIDFRVNASDLHVQSAMQGTALSLVLRMRSMCFPLMFSAECSLVTSTACSVDCFVRPLGCSCNGP